MSFRPSSLTSSSSSVMVDFTWRNDCLAFDWNRELVPVQHEVKELPTPCVSAPPPPAPHATSLEDLLSRVGQSEGHQAAADQRSEGQQDGDGLGDPDKAGEDGAAEDGGQLTQSVQHAERRRPAQTGQAFILKVLVSQWLKTQTQIKTAEKLSECLQQLVSPGKFT